VKPPVEATSEEVARAMRLHGNGVDIVILREVLYCTVVKLRRRAVTIEVVNKSDSDGVGIGIGGRELPSRVQ